QAPSQGPAPLSGRPPALPAGDSRPESGTVLAAGLSPAELRPGHPTAPIAASVPGPAMAPGPAAIVSSQPRQDVLAERFDQRLREIARKLDRLLEEVEGRRGTGP